MKNNKKRNSIFFYIMIVFLIVQILTLNWIYTIEKQSHATTSSIQRELVNGDTILINDVVRPQQRFMANSIKQSWMKYIEDTKYSLVEENKNGQPIYSNDSHSIAFDKDTMYKEKKNSNIYDIFSKDTNKLLLANCKPQWNRAQVEQILSFLVAPVKSFGNNGGVIVFDSYTGKVFLDTTPGDRKEKSPELSIFEDYKNELNKNPLQTKSEINNFIERKDSNRLSSFVYSFNEPTQMGEESLDFNKYPLGQYNRMFVEKLVLPYETFGFDGQPMQLTMLIMSNEKDIAKAFDDNTIALQKNVEETNAILDKAIVILFISTFTTMIVLLIAIYIMKYSSDEKMIRER